ncbi:MAG: hypothetical protein EOP45_10150 [Sphingobacteriaceae bacterium]|nr:MAG: hypothetical protein EOP45_10150 [Sphingobacteriaceae bacterium]
MSELKLKQSNALLQALLDDFKKDPITKDNSIQMIISSIKTLTDSKTNMQIEFEKQKLNARELQIRLGETYNQLQNCSSNQVPALKRSVTDLEEQLKAITNEMDVTNSLVVPLKDVVTKSHDDLQKCLIREKQVLASLTGNVPVPGRPWRGQDCCPKQG